MSMAIFDRIVSSYFSWLIAAPAIAKVIAFFLVWLGCWLPFAIPLAIALNWRPPKPLTVQQKLPLLASLYLIAPFILGGIARLEKVSFGDYGLALNSTWLISLGIGFGLGVLGLVISFALQWSFGWIRWQQVEGFQPDNLSRKTFNVGSLIWSILLPTLLLGLWISVTEELIFRGFLVNQLRQDYSTWTAAAIASLIFALLHLVWEGRERVPQLPGLWLMGMVLVLARWVDNGSLGLACGLHAGWIWGIASLDSAQLITHTGRVSEWITGLAGQPLAGLVGILLLLGTGATLWLFQ